MKQFNEETIDKKQQKNCGEPCSAVCKKLNNEFKKDYEPYQAMGPLTGIFDQRAAEKLNHHADAMGFDAISLGGVLAWLQEYLKDGDLLPEEAGVSSLPDLNFDEFDIIESSQKNANLCIELIDSILEKKGILDFTHGARKFGRKISRLKGKNLLNKFVYTAFGRYG